MGTDQPEGRRVHQVRRAFALMVATAFQDTEVSLAN